MFVSRQKSDTQYDIFVSKTAQKHQWHRVKNDEYITL